jgi:GNAT superfamily N-acetyltransferase
MSITIENGFKVEVMTRAEVNLAVEWAAREGWNPGYGDAECFYAADTGGFLVGKLDGRAVSCISAVINDDNSAFIGFYIVEPTYRGSGFGIAVWRAALERLGARTIGLDAVLLQQTVYAKSGFVYARANVRYGGCGIKTDVAGPGVVGASDVPFDRLLEYDAGIFLSRREAFLRKWITQPSSYALALVRDGVLGGYGVIRPCRTGYKIGPLFSDTAEGAEKLLGALASKVPGREIFLDVPAPNAKAVDLAEGCGMKPVFETARMYKNCSPRAPLEKIFGVTSFELG